VSLDACLDVFMPSSTLTAKQLLPKALDHPAPVN
jgi:hypothetical protein